MITFEKCKQFREMITKLVVCCTTIISKNDGNMIAIDLSKQQALHSDRKTMQKIIFTGNLDRAAGATMLFIIEKTKRNHFRFFTRNCEVL